MNKNLCLKIRYWGKKKLGSRSFTLVYKKYYFNIKARH